MKKMLAVVAGVLLLSLAALWWTFQPVAIDVGTPPTVIIPAPPTTAVQLAVLDTGVMHSRAALAYRGGAFDEPRDFAMSVLLIRHPQGDLLIDAGFGSEVDQHFLTTPLLLQWSSSYQAGVPAAVQLDAAGMDTEQLLGVIVTHSHWDHVSGLPDLPDLPVWTTADELDFIASGHEATTLARQLGTENYRALEFSTRPYLGFARSLDWFDDGSVVVVPAPGHSPGSLIVFVNLPDGTRYALVGDLAWQAEGVSLPAEKPWIARRAADLDADALRKTLIHVHHLGEQVPGLVVLPSHDAQLWSQLPTLDALQAQ